MKRILAFVVAVALVPALAACSGESGNSPTGGSSTATTAETSSAAVGEQTYTVSTDAYTVTVPAGIQSQARQDAVFVTDPAGVWEMRLDMVPGHSVAQGFSDDSTTDKEVATMVGDTQTFAIVKDYRQLMDDPKPIGLVSVFFDTNSTGNRTVGVAEITVKQPIDDVASVLDDPLVKQVLGSIQI
jgi:hypothetical protein